MKTSCIINNYNYSNFVVEAVCSALNQTVCFDEIIVVDDCSTDDSAQVLLEKFGADDRIRLILKQKNEGQLSCFNTGFSASSGDIVFFLDADDVYDPRYLEAALNTYEKYQECNFLISSHTKFEDDGSSVLSEPQTPLSELQLEIIDLGYSAVIALYRQRFIGGPTSSLSIHRNVLEKILPIPYLEDWRTRADDCLVYGASIVGARKFRMRPSFIWYRVHGKNNFHQNKNRSNKATYYRRLLSLNRLMSLLREKMGYRQELFDAAVYEFKTIPQPRREQFFSYLGIVINSNMALLPKINAILVMLKYLLSLRKGLL
jgi:glycosyltransferase involved in cell wall biosynthesis